jgi:DNA processing protein
MEIDHELYQHHELCNAVIQFCTQQSDKEMSTLLSRYEPSEIIEMLRTQETPTNPKLTRSKKKLNKWLTNLNSLPLDSFTKLVGYLTHDGEQWIIDSTSEFWPHKLRSAPFHNDDFIFTDDCIGTDFITPLCLWGMGNQSIFQSCSDPVAVVGSREANEYGKGCASSVGRLASIDGHLVISGGAMGADAAAHRGALEGSHIHEGLTLAVFAGGLNNRGPAQNLQLFDEMLENNGALISELPPDVIPAGPRFLERNRIIAALSSTVVITQARFRSGAINTAEWASSLNRILLAIPGNIDMPYNAGCNELIAQGKAQIITSPDDVLYFLHPAHESDECSDIIDFAPMAEKLSPLHTQLLKGIRHLEKTRQVVTVESLYELLTRHLYETDLNGDEIRDDFTFTDIRRGITHLELNNLIAINEKGELRIPKTTR